ncbi:hypothetical protein DEO72_LG3g1375 [Vigna unguiculata]|uniref:Uncharacterized protein n=1 Tax=Vigna unguiculata TaxID=3917 RepID=A0A4D6LE39_VIGUN|nr:hypothetical protein DEO72_LG3g1374 [Vigna unguiculata]QCD86847.1 hypothetical protein DEO72_LG3g1375 [Vigna unguiculata]
MTTLHGTRRHSPSKQPRQKTLLERSHREQPHYICNALDIHAAPPSSSTFAAVESFNH